MEQIQTFFTEKEKLLSSYDTDNHLFNESLKVKEDGDYIVFYCGQEDCPFKITYMFQDYDDNKEGYYLVSMDTCLEHLDNCPNSPSNSNTGSPANLSGKDNQKCSSKKLFIFQLILFIMLFLLLIFSIRHQNKIIEKNRAVSKLTDPKPNISASSKNALIENALECLKINNTGFITDDFLRQKERERVHSFILQNQFANVTRGQRYSCYAGYCGPWIEDYWCLDFIKLPISEFGVFVPIFCPWYLNNKKAGRVIKYVKFLRRLKAFLNSSFLYFTVSKSIMGVEETTEHCIPPNVFVVNQGGKGHMALFAHLLDLKPEADLNQNTFKYDVIFLGREKTHYQRKIINDRIRNTSDLSFYSGLSDDWKKMFSQSKAILCPRGYGRTTSRVIESLQLGYIPIYVYDDVIYLEYYNSIKWEEIGFIARIDRVSGVDESDKIIDFIRSLTPEKVRRMRTKIKSMYNTHFTTQASMRQIKLFLKYGFARSDLRCSEKLDWA